VHKYLKGESKEDGARNVSVLSMQIGRDNGHKLTNRTSHLNIRKPFFPGGRIYQTLEQRFHTGCGVSVFGDTKKLGPVYLPPTESQNHSITEW